MRLFTVRFLGEKLEKPIVTVLMFMNYVMFQQKYADAYNAENEEYKSKLEKFR